MPFLEVDFHIYNAKSKYVAENFFRLEYCYVYFYTALFILLQNITKYYETI